MIFDLVSWNIVLGVLLRTVIIFFFAFLILRLLGKKQLAHLTYVDLLLIIALGSAVGDVMIYDENVVQMISSMVAIGVVGLIVKVINEFTSHSQQMRKLLSGEARLLVVDGVIDEKALAHEDLDKSQLMGVLRLKGIDDLKQIKKAFIEANGEVSIIRRS
ncbi:DUF421 domain-containing protein [Patescibacteria group bacterium]|nr:DUF421 domain-containing protein [Patescibacteria group bacterium]